MNISQKRKDIIKIDSIKKLFKSSNGKVFLSNTVILLTFEDYMHNYRRGTELVLLDGEGADVSDGCQSTPLE